MLQNDKYFFNFPQIMITVKWIPLANLNATFNTCALWLIDLLSLSLYCEPTFRILTKLSVAHRWIKNAKIGQSSYRISQWGCLRSILTSSIFVSIPLSTSFYFPLFFISICPIYTWSYLILGLHTQKRLLYCARIRKIINSMRDFQD